MDGHRTEGGKPQRVGLGLLGCGTVGGGVVELLAEGAERLAARVGALNGTCNFVLGRIREHGIEQTRGSLAAGCPSHNLR